MQKLSEKEAEKHRLVSSKPFKEVRLMQRNTEQRDGGSRKRSGFSEFIFLLLFRHFLFCHGFPFNCSKFFKLSLPPLIRYLNLYYLTLFKRNT